MQFGDIYKQKKNLDSQMDLKKYFSVELHLYVEEFDNLG